MFGFDLVYRVQKNISDLAQSEKSIFPTKKKIRKMKKEECKVWKLLKISVIQILREINFGESKTYAHKNQNSEPLNMLEWQMLRD